MDRIRKAWQGDQRYEPIEDAAAESTDDEVEQKHIFSWIEYSIFFMLGISMLWAWNAFLAAGPYFQTRFAGNKWVSGNFQAAETAVSSITNLGSMLILTRMQGNASYPLRIVVSLCINMAMFVLLAISTRVQVVAETYFVFLMLVVFATSLATGLCQNGIFAYVSGFGQPRYTQAIMTGQAVAGVLPCIAQIASVLSVGEDNQRTRQDPDAPSAAPPVHSTAATAYFVTATLVATVSLFAFRVLLSRHRKPEKTQHNGDPDQPGEREEKATVSLLVLFRKLFWFASGVFLVFVVTMFFPVFTQRIVSVRPLAQQSPLFQSASFIPLAFLFWNSGDLIGRLVTALPSLSLVRRPRLICALAISRVIFIGLYHLCNIDGRGAVVDNDFFYLLVVQLLFGLSNGYLGSICMISATEWVEPEEKEVAGGFMGLCLVAGLTVGSLASFFATG